MTPTVAGAIVPTSDQPNVLVINTDDQRQDTLWAMPSVRAIATGGVRYTNAYVPTALCCPSRASLLTGRFAHSTGVWGNNFPRGGFRVFDDSDTLATRLDAAGYETAMIGKYLNEYDGSRVPPGWDRWFALVAQSGGAYYDYDVRDQDTLVHYGSTSADYSTDVLADRAEAFIADTDPGNPLFLYLSPYAPHIPATPARRDVGAFDGIALRHPPNFNERDVSDKPEWVRTLPLLRPGPVDAFRQRQLETLLAVDDMVGGVMDALMDSGRLSNTLVIFTSDNAVPWGEHRLATKKNNAYEAASHVPLVIRWDGVVPAGLIDRGIVAANVDIAATVLEATGANVDGIEGVSVLTGARTSMLVEAIAVRHRPAYCGVRMRERLYVGYASGEEEFYNLRRDPWELRNRAERRSPTLRRLRRLAWSLCGDRVPGF